MDILQNKAVVFNRDEAEVLAKTLKLSYELVEQMGARDQDANSATVEYELLMALELLEAMGVSNDELMGKKIKLSSSL